jgi:beta-glucanase (GH16 family)
MTFRTGSFDWTTDDAANSYVDADGLHIVPTLTTQTTAITYEQILNGYTVNLTADGTCTDTDQRTSVLAVSGPCTAVSNSTKGTIINPVRSARLTTAGKKTIRYGRVEVQAKLPAGDWLWPAIWMMPQDNVYGEWPRSGEIDIAESRGNDAETYSLGNNIVSSSLHWGTSYSDDAYLMSNGEWGARRTKYSDGLHTYGLEWSSKYLFTWLDGRLRVSLIRYFLDSLSFADQTLLPSASCILRFHQKHEHVDLRRFRFRDCERFRPRGSLELYGQG